MYTNKAAKVQKKNSHMGKTLNCRHHGPVRNSIHLEYYATAASFVSIFMILMIERMFVKVQLTWQEAVANSGLR